MADLTPIVELALEREGIVEIRALGAGDAAAFQAVRLRAIADAPAPVWPTHEEEAGRTVAEVAARIERSGAQVLFGVFVGAELVGIAGLRRETLTQVRHKATLWGVFISPEQRGAGLARQLFSHLANWAREEGVLQIQLCVHAENGPALTLYRSLGFTVFGREPRALRVGASFVDELHMVLLLDA